MTGDTADLGPIRPEDATDGWRLEGDGDRWWLTTPLTGGYHVRIYPTTATTVAWSAGDGSDKVLREASARTVGDAKSAVAQWIRGQS